ncbi:magnesium transporter CorA family protein [Rhodoflexus caldus]|uniref:magnesium transporter CorA family protein n=1 Tax=Rhodoflexus caldus TaxID=2891236 RepID=UPI002029B600|nr:CorA family divalent cation transporter [Rhodoflexus caldus]
MIESVFKSKATGFEWTSLIDPSLRELSQVAVQYDLHPTSVQDCLEPEHLPKYEKIGDVSFIIVRMFDENSTPECDTVRKMTNKLAFFIGDNFLVSIHRHDHENLKVIRNKWRVYHKNETDLSFLIMLDVYASVVHTYEPPLNAAAEELDRYEELIFSDNAPTSIIEKLYLLRRRASVMKNMLMSVNEILNKTGLTYADKSPYLQDVIDNASRLHYQASQLYEDANNLLSIHLSLASHRTNEVMRILTIFSVFFMPLTFIVGVYGMNFKYMPELEMEWGYGLTWLFMIGVVILIYFWFRRKGWLRD